MSCRRANAGPLALWLDEPMARPTDRHDFSDVAAPTIVHFRREHKPAVTHHRHPHYGRLTVQRVTVVLFHEGAYAYLEQAESCDEGIGMSGPQAKSHAPHRRVVR